jgi:hypothetical protein
MDPNEKDAAEKLILERVIYERNFPVPQQGDTIAFLPLVLEMESRGYFHFRDTISDGRPRRIVAVIVEGPLTQEGRARLDELNGVVKKITPTHVVQNIHAPNSTVALSGTGSAVADTSTTNGMRIGDNVAGGSTPTSKNWVQKLLVKFGTWVTGLGGG